jgi:hypothetical protein
MAYSNGTATDPVDLLQQLVTFLVANGWTQDMSQVEGAGWRAHLHKSGNYIHLRARILEAVFQQNVGGTSWGIDLYTGTAFVSGQPWNNQLGGTPLGSFAGYPVGASAYTTSGPFTNHYFMTDSSADNVVVVIEVTPGLFVYLGWGLSINKAGAFTGGAYFFGSSNGFQSTTTTPGANRAGYTSTSLAPGTTVDSFGLTTTFVRADVDSFTGKWVNIGGPTLAAKGYTGKLAASSVGGVAGNTFPAYSIGAGSTEFINEQTSVQDSRANLLPALLWVNRDGTATGFTLLGSLPMSYASNGVGNGFSKASEYTIGADTYKMFPNFAVLKVV